MPLVKTWIAHLAVLALALSFAGCNCRCSNGPYSLFPVCPGSSGPSEPYDPCAYGKVSCNGPQDDADTCESDPSFDVLNCGGCGNVCPGGDHATCDEGVCEIFCALDEDVCGDQCVRLQDDPANCGACGTVCEGQCTDRRCAGEVVVSAEFPIESFECTDSTLVWSTSSGIFTSKIDGAETLAVATGWVMKLVVAQGRIGAINYDSVFSLPIGGGEITPLGQTSGFSQWALASDGTFVYYNDDVALKRAPIAGGPVETVVSDLMLTDAWVTNIVANPSAVYLQFSPATTASEPPILRVPLSEPSPPASFGPPLIDSREMLALHGDSVVTVRPVAAGWEEGWEIIRIDDAASEPTALVPLTDYYPNDPLFVSGDLLFWNDEKTLFELDLSDPSAKPVARVSLPHGLLNGVCVTGDVIYFATDSEIRRIHRSL